jgi:hypothetical protein
VAVTVALAADGAAPGLLGALDVVALWGVPLAWHLAAGTVLGLLTGRVAGTGLVLVAAVTTYALAGLLARTPWGWLVWTAPAAVAGRIPQWNANRAALVAQAVLLALAAWSLLSRTDRLLGGTDA